MKALAIALVLVSSTAAFASQMAEETTEFTCSAFEKQGQILVGAHSPEIVSVRQPGTNSTTLYVKTAPVVPNPVYTYEKLTQTLHGIDNSQYESQSYIVNMFYVGGLRANIQIKNSQISSNCVHARIQ
jgi:hypothetical protein